jgi:hypothetical protein
VSEDAGIKPGTVAPLAMTARRSITTRLDLIHVRVRKVEEIKLRIKCKIVFARSNVRHPKYIYDIEERSYMTNCMW